MMLRSLTIALALACLLAPGTADAIECTHDDPAGCCDAVNSTNLEPPANSDLLFTLYVAEGTRNFTCQDGKVHAESRYWAFAQLEGDEYNATVYYNSSGIPIYSIVNASTGDWVGDLIVQSPPLSTYLIEPADVRSLTWARGSVDKVTGSLPIVSYITRTETEGGEGPESCTAAPGEWVLVPYKATYSFYGCGMELDPYER